MGQAPEHERTVERLRELNAELERAVQARDQQLADTEERLRTLFENAPLSIQLLDPSGRTLQVNEAWRELWRIPPDVVENFILREYNVLEDPQLEKHGLLPYFHRALAGENSKIPGIRYDATVLGLKGRPRWVEGNLYPVKDAQGRVRQLVLIHEDVTDRREAQELILRKSAEFESLFEHLPEPVIMASADRHIALMNPAANALFGYAPGEFVGKSVTELYALEEDFIRLGQERHNPASTASGPATYDVQYRHRNGDVILTRTTSSVVRSADGTVVGYVGLIRDIRQERRDEEMRRFISEAGDVLASSLDYQETLTVLAKLAVPTLGDWCMVDLLEEDGSVRRAEIVFADPKHEPLKADVARFPPSRQHLHHPPARALFEGTPVLVPVVDRERIQALAQNDDHARVIFATGGHSLISVPLVARSKTVGVLTLMFEATKRSYTERDLAYAKQLAGKAAQAVENARLYRKATEAVAVRDEFMSVCAHELKTPLTSMKLQLQMGTQQLERVGASHPQLEAVPRRFNVVSRQLRRLEKLIDDMLDVSRIATGKLTISLEPTSLEAIVREALDHMSERFTAAGVAVELEVEADLQVQADRSRLAQVLDNLLSNALKYGLNKPVSVRVRREHDRALVVVQDQGPGIAREDLQRIFNRFERAASTRDIAGLGLGLYISRQIAERHGGTLVAESDEGRGARFILAVPLG